MPIPRLFYKKKISQGKFKNSDGDSGIPVLVVMKHLSDQKKSGKDAGIWVVKKDYNDLPITNRELGITGAGFGNIIHIHGIDSCWHG